MAWDTTVLDIERLTHDTKRFVLEKPKDFAFVPGDSISISILEDGWEKKRRPFTMTSIPSDDHIELIVKAYPDGRGMTMHLHEINPGTKIRIWNCFHSITYQDTGVFIAGGAGIAPFISILRDLHNKGTIGDNKLLYTNKKSEDLLLGDELRAMLGDNLILTFTRETVEGYEQGHIDEAFLRRHLNDFSCEFYLCGPPPMIKSITEILAKMKAKSSHLQLE